MGVIESASFAAGQGKEEMKMTKLVPWRWGRARPFRDVALTEPVFPIFSREMGDLFEELTHEFDRGIFADTKGEKTLFNPRLDIKETEKEIEMSVELPGVDKKEIELSVDDGVLTIQGEKKREEEKKEENIYRRECVYGRFLRRVPLPAEVDEKKIEAVFERGILKVTLPKTKAEKKEVHRIAVKAA